MAPVLTRRDKTTDSCAVVPRYGLMLATRNCTSSRAELRTVFQEPFGRRRVECTNRLSKRIGKAGYVHSKYNEMALLPSPMSKQVNGCTTLLTVQLYAL